MTPQATQVARPKDPQFRRVLAYGRPLVVLAVGAAYAPPLGSASEVVRALFAGALLVFEVSLLERFLRNRALATAVTWSAFLLLPRSVEGLLIAGVAALFAFALERASYQRWAVVASALPLLMGALLLQLCPSLASLVLAPLTAVFSLTSALFLQRRAARANVRPAALGNVPPGEGFRRLAQGWPLGLLLAGVSLLLFSRGSEVVRRLSTPTERSASAQSENSQSDAEKKDADAEEQRDQGQQPRRSSEDGFDPTIGFGGGVFAYSDEEVLRLRPLDQGRTPTAVYLRGVVLDRIDADGASPASRQSPPIRKDADDGTQDGWTRFPAATKRKGLEFSVDSRRLDLDGGAWAPLFAAEPLAGIQLDSVAYQADQGLFLPDANEGRLRYRFEQAHHDWSRRRLARSRVRHPSAETVQLPPPQDLPAGLEAFLAEALSTSTRDLETVLSIVGYLRTNFAYERLETGFEGLAALQTFLEERRGFCTHFSTLATLALRSRGLPARVVTGFLAHEWDPDKNEFIVRDRNAHAWIEVHFEDIGWVAFDPTPAQEGRPEFAGGLAYDEQVQALRDALTSWIRGEDGAALATVLDSAVRAGWAWLRGYALWILAALALAWAVFARVRQAPGEEPGESRARQRDATPQQLGIARRFVRALEQAGYARAPGQTLLQLAQHAAHAHPLLEEAPRVAVLHYATRWGADSAHQQELERRLSALEQTSSRAHPSQEEPD